MATYTTTDLLTSIRIRGNIPGSTNNENVNSDTNILNLATEELHMKLLPLIMSVREEFYVASYDYAITANIASYAIPSRAVGSILRDVQLIDGTSVCSLPPVNRERVTTTAAGQPEGFYLQDNNVVLYPTPASTSGTLRLVYFKRPSRLATTSSCAKVSSIDTGTNAITVLSIPSTWVTGDTIDVVSYLSPYVNRAIDQTASDITSTVITLSALPTGLVVGDWVALADYSPIPQVPHEFLPVLAQMTVVKVLESLGDRDGGARAYQDLQLLIKNATQMITPRVQGEVKKVVQRSWR